MKLFVIPLLILASQSASAVAGKRSCVEAFQPTRRFASTVKEQQFDGVAVSQVTVPFSAPETLQGRGISKKEVSVSKVDGKIVAVLTLNGHSNQHSFFADYADFLQSLEPSSDPFPSGNYVGSRNGFFANRAVGTVGPVELFKANSFPNNPEFRQSIDVGSGPFSTRILVVEYEPSSTSPAQDPNAFALQLESFLQKRSQTHVGFARTEISEAFDQAKLVQSLEKRWRHLEEMRSPELARKMGFDVELLFRDVATIRSAFLSYLDQRPIWLQAALYAHQGQGLESTVQQFVQRYSYPVRFLGMPSFHLSVQSKVTPTASTAAKGRMSLAARAEQKAKSQNVTYNVVVPPGWSMAHYKAWALKDYLLDAPSLHYDTMVKLLDPYISVHNPGLRLNQYLAAYQQFAVEVESRFTPMGNAEGLSFKQGADPKTLLVYGSSSKFSYPEDVLEAALRKANKGESPTPNYEIVRVTVLQEQSRPRTTGEWAKSLEFVAELRLRE